MGVDPALRDREEQDADTRDDPAPDLLLAEREDHLLPQPRGADQPGHEGSRAVGPDLHYQSDP